MIIDRLVMAWAALLAIESAAAASVTSRVATPRGAAIEVIVEKPAGSGPFPAVVLASGSGYDMRQPILAETAKALVDQGIAVYRFDWAYRVAGTPFTAQPKDRHAELEDIRAVLALAEHDPAIDRARIAVAGKSLGSIIAWQLLRTTPELKGAILLTPVCTQSLNGDGAAANYPGLDGETRPRLWIMGDVDPACPVAGLQRHVLAAGSKSDRIDVISGNHSFETPDHPDRNRRAFDLMLRLSSDFAAILLAPPQSPVAKP